MCLFLLKDNQEEDIRVSIEAGRPIAAAAWCIFVTGVGGLLSGEVVLDRENCWPAMRLGLLHSVLALAANFYFF
jgi:hypothetical protein